MTLAENLNNDKRELNVRQPPTLQSHSDEAEKIEIIEPAVQEKQVRQTTFVLVAAIAIVLAAIWFVHKKATPAQTIAAVGDQQLEIETAITRLTGIKTENVDQVEQLVKKFYEFADFGQVTSKQLRRNPFNSLETASDTTSSSSALGENSSDVQNRAQKMQLQSILQSKYGNCCMIDDILLYKGDKINNFEVVEIGTDFVRLQTQGHNTILYLQTE